MSSPQHRLSAQADLLPVLGAEVSAAGGARAVRQGPDLQHGVGQGGDGQPRAGVRRQPPERRLHVGPRGRGGEGRLHVRREGEGAAGGHILSAENSLELQIYYVCARVWALWAE